MPIALLRIDDRLVHGQIVEGWLPVLRPDRVWVANDAAAADPLQKTLLSMAIPDNVQSRIETLEESARHLKDSPAGSERVLVLVSGLEDLRRLVEGGVRVESVNIGGLHYKEGKREVLRFVFLDDEESAYLKKLAASGVEVEARALPTDERVSLPELLK